MILTHEQAHMAHAIMELAIAGGVTAVGVIIARANVQFVADRPEIILVTFPDRESEESYPTLADFAAAYDVAGTTQRIEFAKAAQSWEAFRTYHGVRMKLPPCTRDQFERLGIAGRVTKMILGSWA